MKILLFTMDYAPFKGGVAEYYANLVKYWPNKGEINVLNNNDNRFFRRRGPVKWLPALRMFWSELKRGNFEQVIVGQILPLGTIVWLVSKIRPLKYTVVIHGMDINCAQHTEKKRWLAKKILYGAKCIICNSEFTRGLVEEFLPPVDEKLRVVYPGVVQPVYSVENSGRNFPGSERDFVIFSLGRLVKRKGFDQVIKVMPWLYKNIPNIKYYIAGEGPDEEYLKTLKGSLKPAVRDRVEFLGRIDDEEKWYWLRRCQIFAMPDRNRGGDVEGFGIVFLEASLSGKPVIGGNESGAVEAIDDYDTGILVDGSSPDDIKETIFHLYTDIELRDRLGEEGMKRALEQFNWNTQAKLFRSILDKND